MDPDAVDRADWNTLMAMGAALQVEYDMTIPGECIFWASLDTEPLLTGDTNMYGVDLRPVILDVDPGPLGALPA